MSIQEDRRKITVGFVTIAALVALFSVAFGILEPDSWTYLELAQSVQTGHGCTIDGAYIGTEACGYPALIGALNLLPLTGNLIVSSKLLNFALLLGSFALLSKTLRNLPLTALLLFNPAVFYCYSFTLSENLFLFAFCGTWFCLDGIRTSQRTIYHLAGLFGFLLLGCSSRYFFAPFSFFVWLSYLALYGRLEAFKSFPAFAAAAGCFVIYLYFNFLHSGHLTGTERMPAPETIGYLAVAFIMRVGGAVVSTSIAIAIYSFISLRDLRIINLRALPTNLRNNSADTVRYKFLLLSGLCYLSLMFLIRSRISFDLFDYRIIGLGAVFTTIGLLGLAAKYEVWQGGRWHLPALAAAGLFSLGCTQSIANWKSILSEPYHAPAALNAMTHSPLHNKTIVSMFMPAPSNFIAGNERYYDVRSTVITLSDAPSNPQETVDSLRAKLKLVAQDDCVVDFTPFTDLDDFKTKVTDRTYPVALDFSKSWIKPGRIVMPVFNAEIKDLMLKSFSPGTTVPCSTLLQD